MNQLVADYLARLDAALGGLPSERRAEIVADIRAHIEGELAGSYEIGEAQVRTLLDRLGSPSDIAVSALSDGEAVVTAAPVAQPSAPQPRHPGVHEVAAIFLLLFGGFLFGIGWFVGLALLWTSDAWRLRDKVIGTLVVPGGLAVSFLFAAFPVSTVGIAAGNAVGSTTVSDVVSQTIFWLFVVAPVLSACWLGWTAGRGRRRAERRWEPADAVS